MYLRASLFAVLAGLFFIGGCGPYLDDFHYMPHPAVADVRISQPAAPATTQPAPEPQPQAQSPAPLATAYATVVGIRRADSSAGLPLSVEIRLRVDNHGPKTVVLDPRTLDLMDGTYMSFPPPIIRPNQPMTLQPGQSAFVGANFPFPPGTSYDRMDLHALQLRWTMLVDNQPVTQVADFQRVHQYYYDPYWDGPYPYGYGYYGYPYYGVRGAIIIRR